ncbi:MAG: HNH endonuclease, partial [Chloroflexi bacterium]|nr:HNH endonuclease [Chloroflexota bacterium]
MHRLITNAPKGLIVDHIDHNGLNNTRNNLRLCTPEQNDYNRRPQKGSTSKYKGVS